MMIYNDVHLSQYWKQNLQLMHFFPTILRSHIVTLTELCRVTEAKDWVVTVRLEFYLISIVPSKIQ